MGRIYRTPADLDPGEVRLLYESFDAPLMEHDCGQRCAPDNPTGLPFCCDLRQAVPAAYPSEWAYLRARTGLWHPWQAEESAPADGAGPDLACLRAETPDSMILLGCLGPARCDRRFRLLSCRQFPFIPYISSDGRFLGLAPDGNFLESCWVLRNPGEVSAEYRRQFMATFERLFSLFDGEFESYARRSAELRSQFASLGRRIPLLHRSGADYLVSPVSERTRRVRCGRAPA